jgi:hypothetical protein
VMKRVRARSARMLPGRVFDEFLSICRTIVSA